MNGRSNFKTSSGYFKVCKTVSGFVFGYFEHLGSEAFRVGEDGAYRQNISIKLSIPFNLRAEPKQHGKSSLLLTAFKMSSSLTFPLSR